MLIFSAHKQVEMPQPHVRRLLPPPALFGILGMLQIAACSPQKRKRVQTQDNTDSSGNESVEIVE
jgi:hypothetical protein